MKPIINICLIIFMVSTFNLSKGGSVSIKDIYTYSNYYNDDSSKVYLVFYGMFSSAPCDLNSFEINDTILEEVTINACYRIGPLLSGCYRTDTFFLGTFKNGYMDIHAKFTAVGGVACSNITSNNTVNATLSANITNIVNLLFSKDSISLFPNPTSSTLTIQTEAAIQDATAKLTNPEGSVVFSQALTNNKQQSIDIGHLPSGMYFVTVQSAQQKWVRRVVKTE